MEACGWRVCTTFHRTTGDHVRAKGEGNQKMAKRRGEKMGEGIKDGKKMCKKIVERV